MPSTPPARNIHKPPILRLGAIFWGEDAVDDLWNRSEGLTGTANGYGCLDGFVGDGHQRTTDVVLIHDFIV